MLRFIILFAAIPMIIPNLYGQGNKRANIWYFGFNAGIDFSNGSPRPISGSKMRQWEGCSSICDDEGNLVLYSNGVQIWNSRHEIISGEELLDGNNTATQSVLIIPKPGDRNVYYIFTTNLKLSYVVVDMTLNNGDGGIVSRHTLLKSSTEKLCATTHCNNKDTWILAHEAGNNVFNSFLLTEMGLEVTPVRSAIGTVFDVDRSLGYMKFSSAGDRLALAYFEKSIIELFKFDNETGVITDPMRLFDKDFSRGYGLEFSPDGRFLYVGKTLFPVAPIYQIDITSSTNQKILRSKTIIGNVPSEYFGALQLAPDNKIYIARNGSNYLSVIQSPNLNGLGCLFELNALRINSGTVGIGLPNFPSSYFRSESAVYIKSKGVCKDISLMAEVNLPSSTVAYQWYKDGHQINQAKRSTYNPISSGTYTVSIRQKCADDNIVAKPLDIHFPESKPEWVKLKCGLVTLKANAKSNIKWSGSNITTVNESEPIINLTGSGSETFHLTVYDSLDHSCSAESSISLNFGICDATLLIPDIFTPNGDGVNENFRISINGGFAKRLAIYDRWGKVIFTDLSSNPIWDGKVLGVDAESGAYNYILEYTNESGQGFSKRGALLLAR